MGKKRKSPWVEVMAVTSRDDVALDGTTFLISHLGHNGKHIYYIRVPAEFILNRMRRQSLVARPEAV